MFDKYQSIRTLPLNLQILGDFEAGFPPKLGSRELLRHPHRLSVKIAIL
jgi:hypothetical protein